MRRICRGAADNNLAGYGPKMIVQLFDLTCHRLPFPHTNLRFLKRPSFAWLNPGLRDELNQERRSTDVPGEVTNNVSKQLAKSVSN
jgi:hypothetical protein